MVQRDHGQTLMRANGTNLYHRENNLAEPLLQGDGQMSEGLEAEQLSAFEFESDLKVPEYDLAKRGGMRHNDALV